MNKDLIFLFISIAILCFSIVSIFTAPIINNINQDKIDFSLWGKKNCKFFSDLEENASTLDEFGNMRKLKNLCYRQKAMYNLEYSSLIINIVLGGITAQLSLFHFFKVGGSIQKIAAIFGIITGIICFILTLVYIIFSGYIFNNDIAYKTLTTTPTTTTPTPIYHIETNSVKKLYSNGASLKLVWGEDTNTPPQFEIKEKITPYHGDNDDEANLIKYKNLGERQYNYNKKFYEIFTDCKDSETDPNFYGKYGNTHDRLCDYVYANPVQDNKNKNLYDNWLTSLIFCCLIVVCDLGVIIFGFLLINNESNSDLLIPTSDKN